MVCNLTPKFYQMKFPPYLRRGDRVAIVAPAGRIAAGDVLPAIEWLEKWGLKVMPGQHLQGSHFQFSGTDEERLDDLQRALDDPEIRAVFCARGGYGLIRIIDRIDFSAFRKKPKWVAGYSDITLLHQRINRLGIASVHGVMARHFTSEGGEPTQSLDSLMKVLTGEKVTHTFRGHPLNSQTTITGILVGGNLSLIYSLTGTPFDIKTKNKILFLEDIGEYLYHIDRMMHNLRLGGKMSGAAGVLAGQFSDVKDNDTPFGLTVEEIIAEAAARARCPVCFGMPAGHDQPNLALVFGATWELVSSPHQCTLSMK